MNIVLPSNYSSYNDHIHGKKVEEQYTPEFITKAFETLEANSKGQFVHSLQNNDELAHARSVLAPHVFTQLEAGHENKWFSTREQVEHILNKATTMLAENPTGPKAASLKKIIDRAQKNIEKIKSGERVSLPSFYHSTSRIDSLFGILRTSVLAQDAVYGKGAYFSSKPEKEYGDYVIAVDVNDVYDIPLAQQNLANMRKEQAGTKSVWRAFKHDVPINIGTEDNVITRSVYVIVKSEDQRATVIERLGKEGIKNVTVILKEEGKLERKFLKELRGTQEPSAWKVEWERGNPIDKLFSNFILDKPSAQVTSDSDSSDSEWD